ncbi:serine hydrolase domain-containing protein [Hymenobacter crusticola]|uniref:Serine hydrolase n=1 Tax=Hymenobacter crusticola TaxID=1770526 RepID=A0A243WEI6_9BACT|nr:serine hydrolase domain-containing protein [Hymenobacter crusticola]OUJ74062.1 serine hydrolase [Hymenobacter crusticola]
MRLSSVLLLVLFSLRAFAQLKPAPITYSAPIFADTARMAKIRKALPVLERMYQEYATAVHAPGFVYGVMVDGQLLNAGGTGYTNLEQKAPATPQSAFRIASMSKSFTAMAILKLRDAGKLRLDDPVSQYIPSFKKQHFPTTDAPDVTIRHLLTHAAGLPEDNPWGDRQLAISDAQLLAFINNGLSYSNDPGITYEYSNLGFVTLGYIIQKVSGQPYQQYINDNILKPLGMTHTYWEYAKVPAAQLAHGYRWLNEQWVEQPMLHDGAGGAMGGLITTMEDFGKYMAFHQSAWPPSSAPEKGPVKRSSVREMQHPWNLNALNAQYKYPSGRACPQVTAYGYGMRWSKDCENRVTVGHSGGLPGFGSNWAILPDYGIGVACFANVTYAPTSRIMIRMIDTLITLADLKPRQLRPSSVLNERKAQLVKLLPSWNGAEASGIFAENFFLDYFTTSLRKEATALFERAGKIVRVGELVPENGLRGSFLLEGEKENLEVSFTLTPDQVPRIQEYHLTEKKK